MKYLAIKKKDKLRFIINKFNQNKVYQIAICFDKEKRIKGILSLGDLRRLLQNTTNLDTECERFLNKKFIFVKENHKKNTFLNSIYNQCKKNNVSFPNEIFKLNKKNKFLEIISKDELFSNLEYQNVVIFGLGYIGLPLAAVMANAGISTIGYDLDKHKIKDLNNNKLPFYEKDLLQIFINSKKNGYLKITNEFKFNAQYFIICVGAELIGKKVNIKNISNLISKLCNFLTTDSSICIRGTMSVGDMRTIKKLIEKKTNFKIGKNLFLTYLPERLVEGKAVHELSNIPQIVSGYSKKCKDKIISLWSKINSNLIEVKTYEEAEIIKLMTNSYRDLTFAFSNEMNRIISKYNINSHDLIFKANSGYTRNNIPIPSPGVGGSCLVKDPILFQKYHKGPGYKLARIEREINEDALKNVENITNRTAKKISLRRKIKVFILGLTFKGYPENTDIRESSGLKLFEKLKQKHNVKVFDLSIEKHKNNKDYFGNFFCKNINLSQFDIILITNNHNGNEEFLFNNLKKNTKTDKYIIDCWSIINEEKCKYYNYLYKNISSI